jgi:hypothetical protein
VHTIEEISEDIEEDLMKLTRKNGRKELRRLERIKRSVFCFMLYFS